MSEVMGKEGRSKEKERKKERRDKIFCEMRLILSPLPPPLLFPFPLSGFSGKSVAYVSVPTRFFTAYEAFLSFHSRFLSPLPTPSLSPPLPFFLFSISLIPFFFFLFYSFLFIYSFLFFFFSFLFFSFFQVQSAGTLDSDQETKMWVDFPRFGYPIPQISLNQDISKKVFFYFYFIFIY